MAQQKRKSSAVTPVATAETPKPKKSEAVNLDQKESTSTLNKKAKKEAVQENQAQHAEEAEDDEWDNWGDWSYENQGIGEGEDDVSTLSWRAPGEENTDAVASALKKAKKPR